MKTVGVINFNVETWTLLERNRVRGYCYDEENTFFLCEWIPAIRMLYGEGSLKRAIINPSGPIVFYYEYSSRVDLDVVNNYLIYEGKHKKSITGGTMSYSTVSSSSDSWKPEQITNLGPPNRKERRSHFNLYRNKQQWYNQFNVRSHWLK